MQQQFETAKKLRAIRERAGLSMAAIAKAMGLKGSSSYQRYEEEAGYQKRRFLLPEVAEKVAQAVAGKGTPPITRAEVMALAGVSPSAVVEIPEISPFSQQLLASSVSGRARFATGEPDLAGPKNLKVLGFVKAGLVGLYPNNGDTLEMTDRPPFLIGVPDAYAVYIDDRSMFPVLRPGHMIYVHPLKPARPEDLVVIQVSEETAYVKELVRRTDKHIICRQYNPEGEVKYPVTAKIHLVVGIRTVG